MKNAMIGLLAAMSAAFVTGCGNSDSNWYPIDGGRINLSRTEQITTKMEITICWKETKDIQNLGKERQQGFEGPITAETIGAIKKCIREHEKDITRYKECTALLSLDHFTIRLPVLGDGEFKSARDLERMVDSWLVIVEDLFSR